MGKTGMPLCRCCVKHVEEEEEEAQDKRRWPPHTVDKNTIKLKCAFLSHSRLSHSRLPCLLSLVLSQRGKTQYFIHNNEIVTSLATVDRQYTHTVLSTSPGTHRQAARLWLRPEGNAPANENLRWTYTRKTLSRKPYNHFWYLEISCSAGAANS